MVRWFKKTFRVTPDPARPALRDPQDRSEDRSSVSLWFTPLALALVLVNGADVIFAVDSVPAIFAITTDTFVVYTSNIFAILGLRALYFALAAMVDRFAYLKTALAFILIFIGTKIVVADTFGLHHGPAVGLFGSDAHLPGSWRRLQPVADPDRHAEGGDGPGAPDTRRTGSPGLKSRLSKGPSPFAGPGRSPGLGKTGLRDAQPCSGKARNEIAQGGDGRSIGHAVHARLPEMALERSDHSPCVRASNRPVTGRS